MRENLKFPSPTVQSVDLPETDLEVEGTLAVKISLYCIQFASIDLDIEIFNGPILLHRPCRAIPLSQAGWSTRA